MRLTQVHHQHAGTGTCLGSPALARLPDGRLLAVHDHWGRAGIAPTYAARHGLSAVHRSDDDGRTWHLVTHIAGAHWSTLFVHRGAAWLLGTVQGYSAIVIRRSDDGGQSWSEPRDARSGLLATPPPGLGYHGAPVPVALHRGRIWRAFELGDPGRTFASLRALLISAPEDADLLDAASWSLGEPLAFETGWCDPAWLRGLNPAWPTTGWLEGNVLVDDHGRLVDLLRFYSPHLTEVAAVAELDAATGALRFDPASGFITFPGGRHKFTVRRDPRDGRWLALVNPWFGRGARDQRNRLWLSAAPALRGPWRLVHELVADDQPLSEDESIARTGFQYADWLFDGDDLIALVRTAYDGAPNFHDSNRITFHRLAAWRRLLP